MYPVTRLRSEAISEEGAKDESEWSVILCFNKIIWYHDENVARDEVWK